MRLRPVIAIAVAIGLLGLVAIPATAWLFTPGRDAQRLAFQAAGTDLQASDVDAALRELALKVKQVEAGQAELRGAALLQQDRIEAVQSQVAQKTTGTEARLAALENRALGSGPARRRIDYVEGSSTSAPTVEYRALRNLGTFTKSGATGDVLLTWNSHIDAMGEPGTFCDFQLRIDGRPDAQAEGGGGRAVVYVPPAASGGSSPVTVSTLFGRIATGQHTVNLYVRGTARECLENYGNFPRSVLVEESGR